MRRLIAALIAVLPFFAAPALAQTQNPTVIHTACGAFGGTIYAQGTVKVGLASNVQTGAGPYPIATTSPSDCGKFLVQNSSGSSSWALPDTATAGPNFWFVMQNVGVGALTINANGSEKINVTAGSAVFTTGQGAVFTTDGAGNWYASFGVGQSSGGGVTAFNLRVGNVSLQASDVSGVGGLINSNNLSDISSAATARNNLGLVAVASSGSASDLATGTLPQAQTAALTGDVTKSAGSSATTIAANAVTYAKMQQASALKLLGNAGGSTANVSEISLGNNLAFSGTVLNQTAPDNTSTANYTISATDMGGQRNFNGSSLTATIPAISSTIFAQGMSALIDNYHSSALAISTTPTINGLPSSSTIHQFGWANCVSNSTSLDCIGFPGFGTITTNALTKTIDATGATTASSVVDNGTIVRTTEPISAAANGFATEIANDGSTGTTVNKLAKLTSAGAAIIASTTDTDGEVGIVVGGAGTTGSAQIVVTGTVSCVFDATAVTAGHFVGISSVTAGACNDVGTSRPLSAQTIGRALAGGAGSGTYAVALGLGVTNTAGGGSGTVNSGTAGQLGYYATSTTAISGNSNANISGGALTLGTIGSAAGSVILNGGTSGTGTINVAAAAGTGTIFQIPSANGSSANLLINQGSNASAWKAESGDCTITAAGAQTCTTLNGVSPGTAWTTATGTSGHTLPFLDGANTWSGTQTFGTLGGYLDTVSTQSGTTYTLTSTDCGTIIKFTSASAVTVTLPNSLAVGCQVSALQNGAGQLTFSAASGATLVNAHSYTKTFGQNSVVTLFVDTNSGGTSAHWTMVGDGA